MTMPTNPTEQTDVVKEARALAEKFDSAFNIGADPRDVYLDDLVHDWHKAQSLLKTVADEVARLRSQVKQTEEDVTRCAHCGSTEVEDISGEYETGVVAPDGYRERRYENAFRCLKCGRDQEYE